MQWKWLNPAVNKITHFVPTTWLHLCSTETLHRSVFYFILPFWHSSLLHAHPVADILYFSWIQTWHQSPHGQSSGEKNWVTIQFQRAIPSGHVKWSSEVCELPSSVQFNRVFCASAVSHCFSLLPNGHLWAPSWTAQSPTENPSNKGNAAERKAMMALSYSSLPLTRLAHQSLAPPARHPSSTLDVICHRSLGVDMLRKSTTNLPLWHRWVLMKMICYVSERWLVVSVKIDLAN